MDKRLKEIASKIEGDFINLLCTKNDGFEDITEGLRNGDSDVESKIAIEYSHKSILSLRDYEREECDIPTVVEVFYGEDTSLPFFFTIKEDMLLSAVDDDNLICDKGVSYIIDEIKNNK